MNYGWRPYRIRSKKCENEEDITDVLLFLSEFIIKGSMEIWVTGNLINRPNDIIDNPRKIAEQFLIVQNSISASDIRGCRVYPILYVFNADAGYNLSVNILQQLSVSMMQYYAVFQCCSIICNKGGQLALFFVWNNYSVGGDKLTAPGKFKPQLLYQIYKSISSDNKNA